MPSVPPKGCSIHGGFRRMGIRTASGSKTEIAVHIHESSGRENRETVGPPNISGYLSSSGWGRRSLRVG
jgi:hypothetical protein